MRQIAFGAVVLALLVAVARGQGDREARPLLVGVLDIGVTFTSYARKAELEKEINVKKDGYEAEAAKQQATLQAMKKKIDEADAEDKAKLEGELRAKLVLFKAERDEWETTLKLEIERMTLAIVGEIDGEIHAYAKEKGFDLILKSDSKGWGDERFQERIFRSQVTCVMYRADALDVTDAVVKRLNDRAKGERAGKK